MNLPEVSIITCVSDYEVYESCVGSSLKRNTSGIAVQLIPIDNSSGSYSAASALNFGTSKAKAELIVYCHQDVIFPGDWLTKVFQQIKYIERETLSWGVIGAFGVAFNSQYTGHIKDPHGYYRSKHLPLLVQSLDEHCLIIRKSSGLHFDEGLGGFHLYGADICLEAHRRGLRCYAIDALLEHLSGGKKDNSFLEITEKLKTKWSAVPEAPNTIETTCGILILKDGVAACAEYYLKKLRKKIIKILGNKCKTDV